MMTNSDHDALFLHWTTERRSQALFDFSNEWRLRADCREIIQQNWAVKAGSQIGQWLEFSA